jgi:hypothetical protein
VYILKSTAIVVEQFAFFVVAGMLNEYCESDREGRDDLLSERGVECAAAFSRAIHGINAKDVKPSYARSIGQPLEA